MAYQWYLVVGLLVVGAGLIIAAFKADDGFGFGMSAGVLIFLTLCLAGITFNGQVDNQRDYDVFVQQKAYIETHIPKNDIEDAALTQKKIELNGWLYKAQFGANKWGGWSLCPNEVLKMTPIE